MGGRLQQDGGELFSDFHPRETSIWTTTYTWKYLHKSKETSWEIIVPCCSTITRKDALKWAGRTVLHYMCYSFSKPRQHSAETDIIHLGEREGIEHRTLAGLQHQAHNNKTQHWEGPSWLQTPGWYPRMKPWDPPQSQAGPQSPRLQACVVDLIFGPHHCWANISGSMLWSYLAALSVPGCLVYTSAMLVTAGPGLLAVPHWP